jgi:hypothetical protein
MKYMPTLAAAPHFLPFASSDVPGFDVTRNTVAHWSLRLWGHLGPLWADSLSLGLSKARISILRGYARQDPFGRTIADFLLAPGEGAADPSSLDYLDLAFGALGHDDAAPVVLSQFALDGAPDLGSTLYLEVRGPDRIGFLGSLLRTLARLGLSPREMMISTREGEAFDRFYLQTVGGQVPPDEARRALASTLESARGASQKRSAEASLAW